MHGAVQHWDLSSMAFEELCSGATIVFVAKVSYCRACSKFKRKEAGASLYLEPSCEKLW